MSTRRNSAAIAVIGTGMMGPGIAACLALAGHRVALFGRSDQSVDRGLTAARGGIDVLRRGRPRPAGSVHH
jgi:3-hydroxyacyl-CoA dehydrogenase